MDITFEGPNRGEEWVAWGEGKGKHYQTTGIETSNGVIRVSYERRPKAPKKAILICPRTNKPCRARKAQ